MKNVKFIVAVIISVQAVQAGEVPAVSAENFNNYNQFGYTRTGPEVFTQRSFHETPAYIAFEEAQSNYFATLNKVNAELEKIKQTYLEENHPVYKAYRDALQDTGYEKLKTYRAQEKILDKAQAQFKAAQAAYYKNGLWYEELQY